jgi:hypothetical protein
MQDITMTRKKYSDEFKADAGRLYESRPEVWARAGVFDELHLRVLDRLGAGGDLDWSAAILDAAHVRAKTGDL